MVCLPTGALQKQKGKKMKVKKRKRKSYLLEFLCLAEQVESGLSSGKFLGSVEASVVGLSHLFHKAAESNGAHVKKLASFLRKSCVKVNGLLKIVLIRNKNVPADANAVSILIPNPNGLCNEGK